MKRESRVPGKPGTKHMRESEKAGRSSFFALHGTGTDMKARRDAFIGKVDIYIGRAHNKRGTF